MGRSKAKSKKSAASAPVPPTTTTAAQQPIYTAPELLHQAAVHISSCEYELASALCQRAVDVAEAQLPQDATREKELGEAYEMLGTALLELGLLDMAREHFLSSTLHSSKTSDPSPAAHLYLAQLSTPSESLTHFSNALAILQAKLAIIERSKLGADGTAGDAAERGEEGELRRSASRALVGMTELYLTDLCFEEEAEKNCETHLALAAQVDPSDPEVYQTLASVRLSQERPQEAKDAALKGWSLWRRLEPESAAYPPYSTRLAMAQLLLEVSLHSSALEILQRLENEDDEDAEIWYLSGWAWWLLGEERGELSQEEEEKEEEEESRLECWSESRLCLENYLRLDDREPESSDPDQLAHVHELLQKLVDAGVVASVGHEEGDGWNDDDDDDEDEEEEDDDGQDVEMQG